MTDPTWAPYAVSSDAASYPVHNAPPRVPGPDLIAFTWQQLQQIVSGFVNEFLRQVAVALGAIEIFGFRPYEALVEIGEQISAATANFNALLTGFGLPTMDDVAELLANQATDFADFLAATGQATFAALGAALEALIEFLTAIPANLLSGALPTGLTFSGTALSTLLQHLNSSGQFAASALTGGINTAVTFGGTALSTLLQYLNSSGQFAAAQLTGALNGSVTLGGTTLSTLVTNINSSGQLLASGITGALSTGLTVGGVTLGTLFTNINSSGQLLLSGATGALNTAVTLGGTALNTLATNWNAAVTDLDDIVTNAGAVTAAAVGTLLADAQTNATLAVNQIDDAIDNALGGAADAAYAFGQQLQTSFASWLSGWTGAAAPPAASAPQLTDVIAAQREAIVGISTAVAQLQAASAASGSTGVFGGDDFERTDTDDLGTDWSLTYSGGSSSDGYVAITNGHQAAWEPSSSTVTRSVFARRTATADYQTQTNYQKIVWTVGADFEPVQYSDKVWVRLYGRVDSGATKYVFAEIRRYPTSGVGPWIYAVQFGYKNTGSETLIGTQTTISAISPGDTFTAYFGVPATDENYHRLTRNGTEVKAWDDSSSPVAASGASYLGWGFGMKGAGAVVGDVRQAAPASLDSITIADNGPGPGDYVSLPAAGNPGRIYICSDVGRWLKDNGTDWDTFLLNDGPTGLYGDVPDTGWSWVNQGGASTATELGGERITAPSSTRNWRLRVRTLSPSSNYTATARFDMTAVQLGATQFYSGIGLRASGSGSFITFGPSWYNAAGYYTHLAVYRWTNPTTFSAVSAYASSNFLVEGRMPRWLRIRDDNTNRYFEYSHNGVDWSLFYTESRTAYITPDQFIFGADNEGTGYDGVVRLQSLKGIT